MTGTDVRFGVYLPPFGPFGDPRVLVDLAVRAEAAGWDGVFLWDHVVHGDLPTADPWTTLAAIAQATERIRLGPTVTPLSRRRPWIVARHAATVSRLSHGRLILGVGLGSDESGDFSRFGDPAGDTVRAELLDEGIAVIRAMWAGQPYEHRGRHHTVTLDGGAPEPYPLPIWVASTAGSPRVARRAAGCDGIFPNPGTAPEVVTSALSAVRAAGLPEGRDFDVVITGNASPAWDEPSSVDLGALAGAGMTWWMESLIHFDPLDLSLRVVDAGPPRLPGTL
jgi:alkanesulfonate monooxygenase SsuD/methylene tetrahydromethanopterin reductase-like flavin-dependent oxidoreductase (luciferase family)